MKGKHLHKKRSKRNKREIKKDHNCVRVSRTTLQRASAGWHRHQPVTGSTHSALAVAPDVMLGDGVRTSQADPHGQLLAHPLVWHTERLSTDGSGSGQVRSGQVRSDVRSLAAERPRTRVKEPADLFGSDV